MAPILERELKQQEQQELEALIDPQLQTVAYSPSLSLSLSPELSPELQAQVGTQARAQLRAEPEL
jgi:hypothetical protein